MSRQPAKSQILRVIFIIGIFAFIFQEVNAKPHVLMARYCGDNLVLALEVACKDVGYNGMGRRKRGIVDECCHNLCSWFDLQQYCLHSNVEEESTTLQSQDDNYGTIQFKSD